MSPPVGLLVDSPASGPCSRRELFLFFFFFFFFARFGGFVFGFFIHCSELFTPPNGTSRRNHSSPAFGAASFFMSDVLFFLAFRVRDYFPPFNASIRATFPPPNLLLSHGADSWLGPLNCSYQNFSPLYFPHSGFISPVENP